jgi:hypothetical protein
MILQNVISHNESYHMKLIDLKQIQPNKNLTISIHFQIRPSDMNVSYLLIYQFDHPLKFNQLDAWTLLCPSSNFYFLNL